MVRDDISEDIELRRVKIEKRSEIKIFWTKLILNFRKKNFQLNLSKKTFNLEKQIQFIKLFERLRLTKKTI